MEMLKCQNPWVMVSYLADDVDTLKKKVMSMYTDPDHIRVEDPGKIEGNMVFHYLDVFGREEDAADNCRNERTLSTGWFRRC